MSDMTGRIKILQYAHLPEPIQTGLDGLFDVTRMPESEAEHMAFLGEYGSQFRGICVRHAHIDAAMLDLMPNLEVISSYSAGLDGIDIDAARARGIAIYNTSEILAEDVADLALVLALSVTRGTIRGHDFVRTGEWERSTFPLGRSIRSLNTGVVGLGHIGASVARRFAAMGAPLAYYGPRKKPADYRYFDKVEDLAEWADLLIVTCPATDETYRMINAAVLQKLGPGGFLVNVSRGTVIDETALIAKLAADGIAGAALDVFEAEPQVPAALRSDARVVLSPHMGSGTTETRNQMGEQMIQALVAFFSERGDEARLQA
jgi:lactate dehydrogenase-like 2-hydroxyacid dehydrogenase